jgi:hypothetical protein
MPRLYVILLDFCVKEFKIIIIAMLTVGINASAVYSNALFAVEVCRVLVKKS